MRTANNGPSLRVFDGLAFSAATLGLRWHQQAAMASVAPAVTAASDGDGDGRAVAVGVSSALYQPQAAGGLLGVAACPVPPTSVPRLYAEIRAFAKASAARESLVVADGRPLSLHERYYVIAFANSYNLRYEVEPTAPAAATGAVDDNAAVAVAEADVVRVVRLMRRPPPSNDGKL